jgi:predicted Ser/Thr protein kinase
MEIQKIIKELINLNIIDSEPTTYRTLKGGTVSEVYLVHVSGHEYVIKLNRPPVIESESRFLQYYFESPLLPKLIYV